MGFLKRHPILSFLLLMLVGLIAVASLNYSGMCIPKGRWLDDQEKIRQVVALIFTKSTAKEDLENFIKNNPSVIDDFLKKNSECCLTKNDGPYDLPPPRFIDRITGLNIAKPVSGYVYNADNKDIKTEKVRIEVLMTNCGEIR